MSATPDPFGAMQQMLWGGKLDSIFAALGMESETLPGFESSLDKWTESSISLSREWLASHAELWDLMVQATPEVQVPLSETPGYDGADRRFSSDAWSQNRIHDYWRRAYLLNSHYLKKLFAELPIPDKKLRQRLDFLLRQYLDAVSPANFLATNPEVIEHAIATKGESIQCAVQNLIRDIGQRSITTTDRTAFTVGEDLAVTPGKVVFESELFQLLQYAPFTAKVAERPLLIVPPCINKYYILDLQAHNSFVRHAIEQGNTVFMISWRNPDVAQGRLTWDDYIEDGVLRALEIVREIGKVQDVNALGFCVGGTMLATALAVAAVRGERPVASLTLLGTLLDFSAPGDLGCFIDEATLAFNERKIGVEGIFPGREMAAVFSSLRANDMVWQYVVSNYLKGESPTAFDLLYWNADSTNLPGPFLVWYLRNMYLENNLHVPGKLLVCGANVDLGKIDIPAFVFAAREDHIVPWQSAYRSMQLLDGERTFILGASGHVAGVINSTHDDKRSHWQSSIKASDSEQWFAAATEHKGSWWMTWTNWLSANSGRTRPARKRLGNARYKPVADAPGSYVLAKCE